MSDLKSQLLKLGLVSEQQARKAGHEQRVPKPQSREADRAARQQATEQAAQERREADRARERARQAEQATKAHQHRVADLVASGRVDGRTTGNRRFYYESRDGRVPCLELADDAHDGLAGGRLALAESPRGEVTLITADTARRLGELGGAEGWLRVWNG